MGFQFDLTFFLFEVLVAVMYLPVVLVLSLVPLLIGTIFGFVVAIVRFYKVFALGKVLDALVTFIRGVPIALQLIVIYLLVGSAFERISAMLGLRSPPVDFIYLSAALIGLSIYSTVSLSEAMRSALGSVDKGQFEAAQSVGLTSVQLLRRIVVPQALPVAVPLFGNNLIGLIKNTSIASLICVVEIIAGTQLEAVKNYKFLEAYVATAVIYWSLCFIVERATKSIEKNIGTYEKGAAL